MREGKLLKLLGFLDIKVHDRNGDWLLINCPTAHTTHVGGTDKKPSCGVSISSSKPSMVHCFTCGTRKLSEVLHILNWTKGVSKDVLRFYLENEMADSYSDNKSVLEFTDKFNNISHHEEPVEVPDFILDSFEPIDKAGGYLKIRGIDLDIAKAHGLLFCNNFKTIDGKVWQDAIVCPVRDRDFKTYWLHFRSISSKKFWHAKPENFGLNFAWGRSDSWAGIEFLDLNKPVVMVEGFFDMLRLKTLGLNNVIASYGGIGKNSLKVKRILDLSPKLIYTGFDADEPGKGFSNQVKRQANCEVIALDWSKLNIKDPGDLKSKADLLKVLNPKTEFIFQDKFNRSNYELV